MNKKFDRRFPGPTNASLRALIRRVAARYSAELRGEEPVSEPSLPARILALGDHVALTASGRATLKLVADDYAAAAKVKP